MPKSEVIRLARVLHPVTVLGPGRRIGVWVQGCTLACPGCVSQDTWEPEAGLAVSVPEFVGLLGEILDGDPLLTGLSLTGGEPFQQPLLGAAVAEVVRSHADRRLDVLVYTGYAARTARHRVPDLWAAADAVVAGRFRQEAGWPGPWAGSANQTLELLTPLSRERLAEDRWPTGPGIQAVMDDGDLVMVGIPRPGDLERLEERLAGRGIRLQDVSWRL